MSLNRRGAKGHVLIASATVLILAGSGSWPVNHSLARFQTSCNNFPPRMTNAQGVEFTGWDARIVYYHFENSVKSTVRGPIGQAFLGTVDRRCHCV